MRLVKVRGARRVAGEGKYTGEVGELWLSGILMEGPFKQIRP